MKTKKVVINKCFGGFGLSKKAKKEYKLSTGRDFYSRDVSREDPVLIRIIKEMGEKAFAGFSDLSIVEIPDNVEYTIEENDGVEWIAEKHRTWQ